MTTWCKEHGHWTVYSVRDGVCTDALPPVHREPVYCDCATYMALAIPLFQTSECATCHRPRRPQGATS